ncbi:Glutathionylspermidine synthase [Seinonella peptonophila]|uniref:Glutathionylspermidine synthase n=1 Tax=Seinonella peptonophila TaxID=112248 RepID=A0A1M4XPT1_9BACL|nr:glutathionylspermidine synthase family protein [Seinonella peptonophila]SHE95587.1 Glutathionylspermidine synthase [Seinonella peptonophila]
MEDYAKLRKKIYQPLQAAGIFNWDFLYKEEYALSTVYRITPQFVEEIREATRRIGQLFTRVANQLRLAPDSLFASLGLPPETWESVRLLVNQQVATTIGRFDFAYTSCGLKLLEYNSDTPTSIVESFYVNQYIADYFDCENPNQGCEQQLTKAFQQMMDDYQKSGYHIDSIAFSALDWHREDRGTAIYLMKQSGLPNAQFVPLNRISISRERVYAINPETEEQQPIDLLYRLYPLEIMAHEVDEKGFPIGSQLLRLIAEKKVAIVNPPSAFLMQSKAVQALIWNLHEQKTFFTDEEHELIETYLLPTYLDNVFRGVTPYVQKPFFGREGGGVTLFDQSGIMEATDVERKYVDQPMVYQQRVELETIETPTLKGKFQGKVLWGSFFIGGEASAIIARVDREITGDMAYYLPIVY